MDRIGIISTSGDRRSKIFPDGMDMRPNDQRFRRDQVLLTKLMPVIREQLADGHTLCNRAAKAINLRAGQVRTHLPKDVSFNESLDFKRGNKITSSEPPIHYDSEDGSKWTAVPVANNLRQIIPLIENYLASHAGAPFICEAYLSLKKDFLQPIPEDVRFYENETYRISQMSHTKARPPIEEIIRMTSEYRFVGLGLDARCSIPKEMVDSNLEEIIHHIGLIVVLAYDGEGYPSSGRKPADDDSRTF